MTKLKVVTKVEMSAGAIAGIVLGVLGFIVVMTLCGYAANHPRRPRGR